MAPPQPYAAYGAPAGGYGAPTPYGQAPYPDGQAPNPYAGNPGYGGVQPFNGGFTPQYRQGGGWAAGWSTIFWVRLGIAAAVISLSLIGACASALTH